MEGAQEASVELLKGSVKSAASRLADIDEVLGYILADLEQAEEGGQDPEVERAQQLLHQIPDYQRRLQRLGRLMGNLEGRMQRLEVAAATTRDKAARTLANVSAQRRAERAEDEELASAALSGGGGSNAGQ